MLDFCKTVLTRVSFDQRLFAKELKKSFKWLSREDAETLRQWAMTQYRHVRPTSSPPPSRLRKSCDLGRT